MKTKKKQEKDKKKQRNVLIDWFTHCTSIVLAQFFDQILYEVLKIARKLENSQLSISDLSFASSIIQFLEAFAPEQLPRDTKKTPSLPRDPGLLGCWEPTCVCWRKWMEPGRHDFDNSSKTNASPTEKLPSLILYLAQTHRIFLSFLLPVVL